MTHARERTFFRRHHRRSSGNINVLYVSRMHPQLRLMMRCAFTVRVEDRCFVTAMCRFIALIRNIRFSVWFYLYFFPSPFGACLVFWFLKFNIKLLDKRNHSKNVLSHVNVPYNSNTQNERARLHDCCVPRIIHTQIHARCG